MLSIRQDARLLVGEGAAGLGEWAAEASERKVPARDMNVPEPPARSDGEDDVARLKGAVLAGPGVRRALGRRGSGPRSGRGARVAPGRGVRSHKPVRMSAAASPRRRTSAEHVAWAALYADSVVARIGASRVGGLGVQ